MAYTFDDHYQSLIGVAYTFDDHYQPKCTLRHSTHLFAHCQDDLDVFGVGEECVCVGLDKVVQNRHHFWARGEGGERRERERENESFKRNFRCTSEILSTTVMYCMI